jgi:hypothetical protein
MVCVWVRENEMFWMWVGERGKEKSVQARHEGIYAFWDLYSEDDVNRKRGEEASWS